jgi:hypothetical protein
VRPPLFRLTGESKGIGSFRPATVLSFCHVPVGFQMDHSQAEKTDVLQGTLILLVLRTLEALGPLHGYGISRSCVVRLP